MENKKHLLFLIESEIKATQLMYILTGNGNGIDFDVYLSDHSTLIFELLNIGEPYYTEELYSTYFSLIRKGKNIDLRNDKAALARLSLQIYTYLIKYRDLCAVLEEN